MKFHALVTFALAGAVAFAPVAASAAAAAQNDPTQSEAGTSHGKAKGKGADARGGASGSNWLLPVLGVAAVAGIVVAVSGGGGHKSPVSP